MQFSMQFSVYPDMRYEFVLNLIRNYGTNEHTAAIAIHVNPVACDVCKQECTFLMLGYLLQ